MLVKLSSVDLGGHCIRFIYFRQPNEFYVTDIKQKGDIPLFLGADVLASSDIGQNNYNRAHARLTKDKLATKLVLKDVVVEGLDRRAALWFYSVQGVFRMVFEYCPLNVQRDALIKLRDIWLKKPEYKVPDQMTLVCLSESTTPKAPECQTSSEYQRACKTQSPAKSSVYSEPVHAITNSDYTQVCEKYRKQEEKQSSKRTFPVKQSVTCKQQRVSSDHISVNSHPSGSNSVTSVDDIIIPHQETNLNIVQKTINSIIKLIKCNLEVSASIDSQALKQLLSLVTVFSEEISCCPHECGFILSLYEKYIRTVQKAPSHEEYVEEKFGISFYQGAFLSVMAEFLGCEFCKMAKQVAETVQQFKMEHIGCIDDLPNPENLVSTLFPQCMRTLLLHWMNPTHNSKPGSENSKNIYPFMQLILEFANNTLVSGVAHVVFSRLLVN